jgi:hypothetical protein
MSKASKQRPCPALGQSITPATCGEQRESRLKCPADCAYNPFNPANYSGLLEIEDRVDAMTLKRFKAQSSVRATEQYTNAKTRDQGLVALHSFYSWNFFLARNDDQTTFSERWIKSADSGLKNDERVLLSAKMQVRIALLEVHRLLPGDRIEAVDLLSPAPAPIVMLDRSLASIACRFSTFLAWIYPTPHYWHLSGTMLPLPDVPQLSGPEIVREIVQHLGGPITEAEMRRWLAEHLPQFHLSLDAFSRLRRQQMLTGMDAKVGKAVYQLQAPFAQCRDLLVERDDICPDDLSDEEHNEGFVQAYVWFDARPKAKIPILPEGQTVLGRVILGQSLWRLETFGGEQLSRLRKQFEKHLGKLVRFSGERIDDLAAQMASKEPSADQSLVPPRLLENPVQLSLNQSRLPALAPGVRLEDAEREVRLAAEKAFLDDHVPALDNKTPREAARDLLLRPKLIHLFKQRVRSQDERNLTIGGADDLNWMLRELDLHEIIFDPPPFRPPPPGANPVEDEESDPEDFDEFEPAPPRVPVEPNRPPAPKLPAAPLNLKEAADRLEKAMLLFGTFAAAQDELDASGATLLDDIDDLTADSLPDRDYTFALPFIAQIWFALVPTGCRAPEIDFDDFEAAYASNLRQLLECAKDPSPKKLESFFRDSLQPDFMTVIIGGVFQAMTTVPKEFQPSPPGQPIILALLKTLVQKLSEALRPK